MIVKDESHIIGTTLENLVNTFTFDYWVICDTGSTDTTKDIITEFFQSKGIKGELLDDPWKDFGTNRTHALEFAYKKTDYVLMFDADDAIIGSISLPKPMTADLYGLLFSSGGYSSTFHRYVIFNNHKRWRYVGVLHEYLECMEKSGTKDMIVGDYKCLGRTMGNRSKDPEKYKKDALVLKAAYEDATVRNDSIRNRYAFYCANSYKDCSMYTDALEWYKRTLTLDNWAQEKYIACLRIYEMNEALKTPEHGFHALVESLKYDSERVECMYILISHYLIKGMNEIAFKYYECIQRYYENDYPNKAFSEKLFVNLEVHNFYLPYHMIILADRVKQHATGVKMYSVIFRNKFVHKQHWYLNNLFNNLEYYVSHITPQTAPQFAADMRKYIGLCREVNYNLTPQQEAIVKRIYMLSSIDIPNEKKHVVVAILAKDKAYCLPFYLACINNQTFPKERIHLYIRTNDNKDATETILADYIKTHGDKYASVVFDTSSISDTLRNYKEHEWNSERFRILGQLRMDSVNYAKQRNAHYFVADVDNFIVPSTLETMMANMSCGVISPMLDCKRLSQESRYSNFHYEIDARGYYKETPAYDQVRTRVITGLIRVPVVHCTYFIRNDLLDVVEYDDSSKRHEYVVLCDNLRKKNVSQYLDNRVWYGFLVLTDTLEEYLATLDLWKEHMSKFT